MRGDSSGAESNVPPGFVKLAKNLLTSGHLGLYVAVTSVCLGCLLQFQVGRVRWSKVFICPSKRKNRKKAARPELGSPVNGSGVARRGPGMKRG